MTAAKEYREQIERLAMSWASCVAFAVDCMGAKNLDESMQAAAQIVLETLQKATVSQDENVADEQQNHPKQLKSRRDYENAPDGTIVAQNGASPWIKVGPDYWRGEWGEVSNDLGMTNEAREVLRWGRCAG